MFLVQKKAHSIVSSLWNFSTMRNHTINFCRCLGINTGTWVKRENLDPQIYVISKCPLRVSTKDEANGFRINYDLMWLNSLESFTVTSDRQVVRVVRAGDTNESFMWVLRF